MTGVTGQTWNVFTVSGLMTDRVKSSLKVSGIMTGLRGQITCSLIAMGQKETSNTLLESGPSDHSKSKPLIEIGQVDNSPIDSLVGTGQTNDSTTDFLTKTGQTEYSNILLDKEQTDGSTLGLQTETGLAESSKPG